MCTLLSWFNFYCLTRSFSNSLETVLTVTALSYWPWRSFQKKNSLIGGLLRLLGQADQRVVLAVDNIRLATVFASLSFVIRPTSAIIWFPLYADYLWAHLTRLPDFFFRLVPIP